MFPDEACRPISAIPAIFSIIVQRTCNTTVQEARHVHAVGDGELLPVLAPDAAAAVVRAAGAVERLVEVDDEAAVIDEDFLALDDISCGHDVARYVIAEVRVARVIDEVIGGGYVADVHRADDLV